MKKISITSSRKLTVFLLIWYLATALGCVQSGQPPSTQVATDGNQPPWVATALSLQAPVAAGRRLTPMGTVDHAVADGFLGYTIVVDHGFGFFQIDVPRSWISWYLSFPPTRLVDIASKVDAQFAGSIRARLESAVAKGGSSLLRGFFLTDEKSAMMTFGVNMHGRISEEQWRSFIEKPAPPPKGAVELKAADVVQHTTGQAIKLELRFPFLERDWAQIEYYIFETNNRMLWSLQCSSSAGAIDRYRQTCADSVATFFPGPYIISDYE